MASLKLILSSISHCRSSTSRGRTDRRRSTSTSPSLTSLAEVAEAAAEDVEAGDVEEIVVTVERDVIVLTAAKAESVVSDLIAEIARKEVRPAVEDPAEEVVEATMAGNAEVLVVEDAAETVEVAEAAKSSASTKTPSPPWDRPQRR